VLNSLLSLRWVRQLLAWLGQITWLGRLINRIGTNSIAHATYPRPRPYSLWGPDTGQSSTATNGSITDYASWPSLTNRSFSARHLAPAAKAFIDQLPPDAPYDSATGGTGVTGRDVTPEALDQVAEKMIPGFGELFRWLSFQSIGTSTIQSRACAGLARGTYIFCLPGSTGAVKDGWDGILASQLDARHRPCNFVELLPRLRER
jgi:hypothetical protein